MIPSALTRRRGGYPTTLAVSMTAAASGSSGITVADDDDIDFGTGDFTIHVETALPDFTPASIQGLVRKLTDDANTWGWALSVNTDGKLRFYMKETDGTVVFNNVLSSVATSITDNANAKITAVVTRETASVAGSLAFYVNGAALGTSTAIATGAPGSVSTSAILYILGNSTARNASVTRAVYAYNRALSASDVLSLCDNGVASADSGASQTSLVPSPLDFTSGWNVTGTASITDADTISLPANGDSVRRSFTVSTSKNYRLRLVGTTTQIIRITDNSLTNVIISSIPAGAFDIILETTLAANGIAVRNISGSATTVDFTTFTLRQIGCTLQLEPPGLTASGLTWTDSSGNGLNGTLPAAGATKVTIRK